MSAAAFGGRYRRLAVSLPRTWPDAPPAMFHGLIGELAHAVEDISEADPAAIVGSLLAYSGAVVGKEPYLSVNGMQFRPSLFVALVGPTADGRKGTAAAVARQVMQLAAPDAVADLCRSGFGSGEGLVTFLAAAPGRHLLIEEEEFGGLLTAARRDGSTLSPIVRKLWDGQPLANVVKDGEAVADDYHACLLGHITPSELEAKLAAVEQETGFANRFLLVASHRRFRIDWDCEGDSSAFLRDRLRKPAEALGRHLDKAPAGPMRASGSGWEAWLEHRERSDDRWMRSRRAAHLGRLALVFALADGSAEVTGEHIAAAAAMCDYSEATAAWVFGPLSGDPLAKRVLDIVSKEPEGVTLTELQGHFGNHLQKPQRDRVVQQLVKEGLIVRRYEGTRGRSRVRLMIAEPTVGDATEATEATEEPAVVELGIAAAA
jgi:hypothetical protein